MHLKLFALCCLTPALILLHNAGIGQSRSRPNVIIIYADDLGYGDLSCYGATRIATPNIDKLAASGLRFTQAHSAAATCTPSRYAMLTGRYAWRQEGTGVLPGNAALIISPEQQNLASVFKAAGYATGVVGKWHLGLGTAAGIDWNKPVKPGPNELGFDYAYIFPATADRVPTVFLENGRVVGLEPQDPIVVDYQKKVGNEPTGMENPELLKMKVYPNQGHLGTIVNGIGRMGWMSGGKNARWVDEELADVFTEKARSFVENHRKQPFFLYFALNDIHAPRMPSTRFKGSSPLGLRGDMIHQMDWAVGALMEKLDHLGLTQNTIVIFSSDNGPALIDAYDDRSEELARREGHDPRGGLRGGKYSIFEAGTRIPMLVSWPGVIRSGLSPAMVGQWDYLASFAKFLRVPVNPGQAPDSQDYWEIITGKSTRGRTTLVEQGATLALRHEKWKYIEPKAGPAVYNVVNIESGLSLAPQLYDLEKDPGETKNLANEFPEIVKTLSQMLDKIRKG